MDDTQSGIETSRGETLKALREKNEWSIEEVAASLNLRVEVIRSLESDDYSALPEQTYVRGYIRSYGRLLGLQEVDALNDLPETRRSKGALGSVIPIMGGSELKYAQEVPKTAVSNPAVRLWLRPVLLSIAAILLILIAWWASGLRPSSVASIPLGASDEQSDSVRKVSLGEKLVVEDLPSNE